MIWRLAHRGEAAHGDWNVCNGLARFRIAGDSTNSRGRSRLFFSPPASDELIHVGPLRIDRHAHRLWRVTQVFAPVLRVGGKVEKRMVERGRHPLPIDKELLSELTSPPVPSGLVRIHKRMRTNKQHLFVG